MKKYSNVKDRTQLIDLISMGQEGAVQELISKNPNLNINERDSSGASATIVAAQRNQFSLLELLVKNGGKVNVTDGVGRSPLGWAKQNGDSRTVQFIEETITKETNNDYSNKNLPS